ncbi:MAG TPA: hypothetical protein VFX89_15860 [Gammaproteobacteria bacterium]|nr:hypothetical protein [Gammaproteobacteria bacterium]
MPHRLIATILVAAAALALGRAHDAAAQAPANERELARKLGAAKRLECKFTTLATGTWDGAKTSATVTKADVSVTFTDIDVDSGTAEADSGFGNAFISVKLSGGYLHFMQISDTGPLYVTTVLATETAPGRLKAMQTRHEYSPTVLPGFTSRPELYVGDCAVK